MNKEWADKNKQMQSLLKKATFTEGITELINLRTMLLDEILSWKQNVTVEAFSKMPFINAEGYHSKTIAYSIWHIMRIEDIVVNTLINKQEEVYFSTGFVHRMNSPIITTGNELVKEEIAEFSQKLNLDVLFEYAEAVKKSTDNWLRSISYTDLKLKFTEEDKLRIQQKGVVSDDKEAVWLIDYWCNKDINGLLRMPLSRHWIMHIEAAIRIKNKLNVKPYASA